MKKHILMNGMDNSYTQWIHHRESLNVDVTDHGVVVHDPIDVDVVIEEDNYGYGVDPLEEVLGDLHSIEQARHDDEN